MKINEFELKNYQGIKHLLIKNPPDTVVLIGTNGSGKSTVLKALNSAMRYCMGYETPLESGIRVVLDLKDHLESIKNWINNRGNFPNKLNYIRKNRVMDIAIHDHVDRNIAYNHFKTNVFPSFSKTPLIEVTSKDIKLIKNQYDPLPPNFGSNSDINSTYINDLQDQSNSSSIYGRLLINWIIRRKSGVSDVPGVAFFDSEKITVRDSIIDAGQLRNATLQRVENLYDQDWRAQNLGERLLSLITQYSQKEVSSQDESYHINPVKRINDSLQLFTPHLSIISPLLMDTTLWFESRGVKVKLNQLSSGEISLINFAIDYLEFEINRGILIIDEPSSYLHYDLQSRLVPFIEELVTLEEDGEEQRPQIWLATHSPPIINSVSENSVYIINLEAETSAKSLTSSKTAVEKKQLLSLLGVSHYFDQRPVLFVEGKDDIKNLQAILKQFNKKILTKWHFHLVNGVQTIEIMRKNLNDLKTIAEQINAHELKSVLRQNHFLKDGDNTWKQTEEEDLFVWDFYHLENVLFQDEWLDKLEVVIEHRSNNEIDIKESLNLAKEEIYNRMKPPLNEQLEELINTDEWKKKLKGRDLFKQWNNKMKISHFSTQTAIKQLVSETNSISELPSELVRFITWLETKHREWKGEL